MTPEILVNGCVAKGSNESSSDDCAIISSEFELRVGGEG